MVAPTVRGSVYSTSTGTTDGTLSLSGAVTGDWMLLVAVVGINTINVTTPAGWTVLVPATILGSRRVTIFGKIKQSGDTIVTVVKSGSVVMSVAAAYGPGANTNLANWQVGVGKLRATAPAETVTTTALSITTTVSDVLAIAISAEATSAAETITPTTSGTGWTNFLYLPQPDSNNIEQIRMASKTQSVAGATGNETDTYGNSQASNGYGVQIGLPPAGSNIPPTPGFSTIVSDLTVTITSTASDPDGTIASISYNYGDGNSGSSTSHNYLAYGTYTITQAVTDNSGDVSYINHDVVLVSPSLPGIARIADVNYPGILFYFDGTTKRPIGSIGKMLYEVTKVSDIFGVGKGPWFSMHRGGSYNYPEETLYGYRGCADAGAKVLEVSIQYSSDGTPWCFHDATVDRTVVGSTGNVSSFTDIQLAAMVNKGSTATGNTSQPSRPIAKFVDVANAYSATHVLIVEDKSYTHTAAFLNMLDSYGTLDRPANERFIVKIDGAGGDSIRAAAATRGYQTWGYLFDIHMGAQFTTALTRAWSMLGLDYNSSDATLIDAIARCNTAGIRPTGHIVPSVVQRDRLLALGMTGLMLSNKLVLPNYIPLT